VTGTVDINVPEDKDLLSEEEAMQSQSEMSKYEKLI